MIKKYLSSLTITRLFASILLAGLSSLLVTSSASAGGTASLSVSPGSGSYTVGSTIVLAISETSSSGDAVNAVQVNLSYPSSLQFVSTSLSGPFTLCGQQSGGGGVVNIGCAASSAVSGTQSVAQVSFKVLSSGTATVSTTSGSDIQTTSGTSVFNGSLPSATYTLKAVTTAPTTPTTPVTTTTTKSSSSTAKTTPSAKTSTSPKTATTVPASATPETGVLAPVKTTDTTPIVAQLPASISVTVTDSKGKPVSNAKVILDSHFTEFTNSKGVAGFSSVASGSHSITISAHGAKSHTTSLSLSSGQSRLVSISLAKHSSPVVPVLVLIGCFLVLALVARWFISRRQQGTPNPLAPSSATPPTLSALDSAIAAAPTNGNLQPGTTIAPVEPPSTPKTN